MVTYPSLLIIIVLHAMKASKFEQIITSAISKVKPVLSAAEAQSFQQMLSSLPKRIKQFNAEPYLFIFEAMLRRKELVDSALTAFATMLQENYITVAMYDRLAGSLAPLMKDHAYSAVQTILRIKEPHLDFLRLYFQVHSTVALPEDILRKFKAVGYAWLNRAFAMTQRDLPQFESAIYAKFYPEEMPRLARPEEEEREVRRYVGLVLGQAVETVQERLEGGRANRGKYGFCFLCKQSADYYCKDTRVPVCGVDCKKAHLELLARSNALNGQYSVQFLCAIEEMLVSNLEEKVSPALSIDFLVAIYCFSSYRPQCQLPHPKILSLPVIYQRIWMLYLSHCGKQGLLCQHIIASCLTVQEQFVRSMANEYFLKLAADNRFIAFYASYDRAGEARLTDFLLRSLEEVRRGEFIESLVGNLFNAYSRNNNTYEHSQAAQVRAFNHEKDLSAGTLAAIFGDDAQRRLIKLIIRNQLAINRDKLGQFLYANEDILRLFLMEIVAIKRGAPIDELLRQIFYFINVKISDKIYRLFEILSEVYESEAPFDQMTFFTYAYFVIMVVTQLNNPAVTAKPTLSSVLSRVEQFSPLLAKQHAHIVQGMFERVSTFPFSQTSRGVLSHYRQVRRRGEIEIVRAEQLVVQNNELIYEVVIACVPDVLLLYRLCCLVANHPAICQLFLQLLVDKLLDQPRDAFLIQAISLVVDQQPNAAGCLWRQILEDRPAPGQASFNLGQLVQASAQLTDGNFKQFVRELCQVLPITSAGQHYVSLLSQNRGRVGLAVPLLMANYDRCDNVYIKVRFLNRLGLFLEGFSDEALAGMARKMIEELPVTPITEALLVEGVTGVRWEVIGQPCLRVLAKKCLQLRNEKTVQLLQGYLKRGGEEFYESYLIQKTLNCCKKEHISLQILKNLRKLEPYIRQIRPDLLRMFVMPENLDVIIKFFDCFCSFNATYDILLEKWEREPEWMDSQKEESLIRSMKTLLFEAAEKEILQLFNIPRVIVRLLKVAGSDTNALLLRYLNIIKFKQPQDGNMLASENAKIIVHFNILTEHLSEFVKTVTFTLRHQTREIIEEKRSQIQALIDTLHSMHEESRSFQTNITLRLEIRKLLRVCLPQTGLPSLLSSSILVLKSAFALQDVLQHHSEPSLMRILHAVQWVIERQSQLRQSHSASKRDSVQRMALMQANKQAILYGQIAIESAFEFVQEKGELNGKDRATMKRILISILMQGHFNEDNGSFQSLAGSQLAGKVEQIFHLLK